VARQADLLPVAEARARVLGRFGRLDEEITELKAAHRRVLARDISAPLNLPPFSNSSMDGFALVASATESASPEHPVGLRVTMRIPAGSAPAGAVAPGETARIMTGAPLPAGADAVIPFEDVDDRGDEIFVPRRVAPSACVRPAGQDVKEKAAVLRAATELRATQLALLAAIGIADVPVVRRPEVAVVSTGDELAASGTVLRPGQIYNSNSVMLSAAVEEAGGAPRTIESAGDSPDDLRRAFAAARGCDLLITTGGASVGDYDYVKEVIGEQGDIRFWRVRLRPGKPLIFGSVGDLPVLGLPGNPTSAMVTFELFVRPAIRTMLGLPSLRPRVPAIVDERVDNHGERETYARVRLHWHDGRLHASLSGPQDSAMIAPLAHAHGLLVVPAEKGELAAGEIGEVEIWELPHS
jgi:molybdopterin molybdotransferase